MRILVVDDEPLVVRSLSRLLRSTDRLMEVKGAHSGSEALALMEEDSFDLIFSDIRMPEMDGERLLHLVRERFPATVRVAFSGYTEANQLVPVILAAQRYLSKPVKHEQLVETLRRLRWVQRLLGDRKLRQIAGGVDSLPPIPESYSKLTTAIRSANTDAAGLARLIAPDPALTAKLLQLANSSVFCVRGQVTSLQQAVVRVGLNIVQALVLALEGFASPAISPSERRALQRRGLLAANVAAAIARESRATAEEVEECFTAGLLHDIGLILLAESDADGLARRQLRAQEKRIALHQAEEEVDHPGHASMGAYLLGLWGLPRAVVEAIAAHHVPGEEPTIVTRSVHAAVTLTSDKLGYELLETQPPAAETLLDTLGLSPRQLARFNELAQEQAQHLSRAA